MINESLIPIDLSCLRKQGNANLNANNNTTIGMYVVPQNQNATNYPFSGGNGFLVVFAPRSDVIYQLCSNYIGSTWVRICWFGTWREWIRITN